MICTACRLDLGKHEFKSRSGKRTKTCSLCRALVRDRGKERKLWDELIGDRLDVRRSLLFQSRPLHGKERREA